ncbi:MAG: SDR family NAD(P)-dependent oxidoreductase [Spirochaetia bacterium]|nr:SDR family NAD(P)-dependent oxidoreductase [Spirochaetia bacterium]
MNKNYFKDKIFLITGASSGIGLETTTVLLKNGAYVSAMVRNASAMDSLKKQYNEQLMIYKGDVSLQKDCEKFVTAAVKKWNSIYCLIHCAGVGVRSAARDIHHDVFRNIMDVNFYAMVYLFSAARKYLKKTNGHVIAVSSVHGIVALPFRSAYSAAKHALNAYIKSVGFEENSICFLCVNFGYVKTNFSNNAVSGHGEKFLKNKPAHLQNNAKGMNVTKAVKLMLNAMVKCKKEITPAGFKEKFSVFVYRYFPSLFNRLVQKYVKPD